MAICSYHRSISQHVDAADPIPVTCTNETKQKKAVNNIDPMLISLSVNLINLSRRSRRFAYQPNTNRRGFDTALREDQRGNYVNFRN